MYYVLIPCIFFAIILYIWKAFPVLLNLAINSLNGLVLKESQFSTWILLQGQMQSPHIADDENGCLV